MAKLKVIPEEDLCLSCSKNDPIFLKRLEIIKEDGSRGEIYDMVADFYGCSFDTKTNAFCYICQECISMFKSLRDLDGRLEELMDIAESYMQDFLIKDSHWIIPDKKVCMACSEKSNKKETIIVKEVLRTHRKKEPPPKKGIGYDLVSTFFQHSFLANENGDAFICVRCANRLRNILELRKKKGKLEGELHKSSQKLKPYTENVIVLYNFNAVKDDELEAAKGDMCEILYHRSHLPEWHFVKNVSTGTMGYIPQLYVSKNDGSPQIEEWWQNVDRKEAEKILMNPGNKKGVFLIRKNSDGKCYVLSVLEADSEDGGMSVAHYQIFQIEKIFRISTFPRVFTSLQKIIARHQIRPYGLSCKLTQPCERQRPIVPFRELEIAAEDVEIKDGEIGQGILGKVYLGAWRKHFTVAVKKVDETVEEEHGIEPNDFVAEVKMRQKLNHRNLVQMLAVSASSTPILVVMEYMSNKSLKRYLKQDKGDKITLKTQLDIISQITNGMHFLEIQGFIHKELSAAKVLVGDNNIVKIVISGITRGLDKNIYEEKDGCYLVDWMAPESVFNKKFSVKSDVWAFGILLYEIITFCGVPLYQELAAECESREEVATKVRDGYRLPKPEFEEMPLPCSDSNYEVMTKCWNEISAGRPTFAYLHDYFSNYQISSEPIYREYFQTMSETNFRASRMSLNKGENVHLRSPNKPDPSSRLYANRSDNRSFKSSNKS